MKTLLAYFAIAGAMLGASLIFSDRTVSLAALFGATAVWWVFVIWYAMRSKWHKNPYGRNTMGTAVGLAALLTVFSTSVLFQRYEGYEVIWGLVFLNLLILGAEHTYYMEKAQRQMPYVGKDK